MSESIAAKLAAARHRWRVVDGVIGVAITLSIVLLLCFVSFYSDRLLVLGTAGRTFWLAALITALVASLLVFLLYPMMRPMRDEVVAEQVERKYPTLGERLLTTIELAHAGAAGGMSVAMVGALSKETESFVKPLDFARAIPCERAQKPAFLASFCVLALIGHVAVAPGAMSVWFARLLHPGADIPIYARTQVWVTPDMVIPRGEGTQIGVRISGRITEKATVHYRIGTGNWAAAEIARSVPAPSPDGEARNFKLDVPEVLENLTYYATAGDGRSNPHTIRVEDRPALLSVKMQLDYPAYTHKKTETIVASAGNLSAPVGTHVGILATANKPLQEAVLLESGKQKEKWPVSAEQIRGSLKVTRDENYGFHLVDKNGFEAKNPPEYTIRAQPDRTPEVQISQPGTDMDHGPTGSVFLNVRATDDYGVESLRIRHTVGKKEGSLPLPMQGPPTQVTSAGDWNLDSLHLKAGDTLIYEALARDSDSVTGPHTGRSSTYRIHILGAVEMRERLEAQQAQEREALRQLLARQKEAEAQLRQASKQPEKAESMAQAEGTQRAVSQEAQDLAKRMQQTSAQMRDNRVGTQTQMQRREATQNSLQRLGQKEMPAAADTIQRAQQQAGDRSNQLNDAARQERQIRQELERMSRENDPAASLTQLAQEADNLAQEQQRLAEKSDLAAAEAEKRQPQQMSAKERAKLNNLAKAQSDLKARTQDLQNQIQRTANEAAERGKPESDALKNAARQMPQSGTQQKQESAKQNLSSGKPNEASPQQNQAAQDLRNLAKDLDEAVQKSDANNLEKRADKLEEAADKLNELYNKHRKAQEETRARPDSEQAKKIAEKERQIGQDAKGLQNQLKDAPAANQSIKRADQRLQDAAGQLDQNQSQQALDPERQAASDLLKAQQEARQAAQNLRDQQAAREMQQALQQLAKEQGAARKQTESLDSNRKNGQLSPEQQKRAQELAAKEQQLLDKGRELTHDMPTQAFRWAMGEATRRMENAQKGLQQNNPGSETQQHQQNAEQTLNRIARALGQQSQGMQQQRQGQGEQSSGESAMADASGELQLSREMEAQLRQETGNLDRQRNRNPNRQLSAEQQRELNALQQAQSENRRIADKAAQNLRASPDIAKNVQRAAEEMADVQDMLGRQETGTPTQGKEDQIVGMLDQALQQTKQAMRQQRQRMAQQGQGQQQPGQQGQQQQQAQRPGGNDPAQRSYAPVVQPQDGRQHGFDPKGRGFGALSPRAQQSLREGKQENVPAEYRELVNQYFKSLSERGGR